MAVLCVALTPLASFADTDSVAGQIACPALLMEGECRAYLAELRRARTKAEMRLFEDRYAALLKERFSLCPHSAALKTVKNADDRPQPQRVFPGKKISM